MLAAQAEGHNIATIESLGEHPDQGWLKTGGLHPLATKPLWKQAPSNAATALLHKFWLQKSYLIKIQIPREEEVREAISGVLCRCTGYLKTCSGRSKSSRSHERRRTSQLGIGKLGFGKLGGQ